MKNVNMLLPSYALLGCGFRPTINSRPGTLAVCHLSTKRKRCLLSVRASTLSSRPTSWLGFRCWNYTKKIERVLLKWESTFTRNCIAICRQNQTIPTTVCSKYGFFFTANHRSSNILSITSKYAIKTMCHTVHTEMIRYLYFCRVIIWR